jgi:hypothetical protein
VKHLLTVSLITLLTGCGERWEGYVYPEKTNLAKHIYIGEYESLEKCRSAAIQNLNALGKQVDGDYECGLNCEVYRGSGELRICEKTNR